MRGEWRRDVGEKRPDRDFFHATMMTDFIFATLDKLFSDIWAVYCMIYCPLKLHRDSAAAHANRRMHIALFVSLRDASRASARELAPLGAWPMSNERLVNEVPVDHSTLWSMGDVEPVDDDDDDEPLAAIAQRVAPIPTARSANVAAKHHVWIKILTLCLKHRRPSAEHGTRVGYEATDVVRIVSGLLSQTLELKTQSLNTLWDSNKIPWVDNGTVYMSKASIKPVGPAMGAHAKQRGFIGEAVFVTTDADVDCLFDYVHNELSKEQRSEMMALIFSEHEGMINAPGRHHASTRERSKTRDHRLAFRGVWRENASKIQEVQECASTRVATQDATAAPEGNTQPNSNLVPRSNSETQRQDIEAEMAEAFELCKRRSPHSVSEEARASFYTTYVIAQNKAYLYQKQAKAEQIARGWDPSLYRDACEHSSDDEDALAGDPILDAARPYVRRSSLGGDDDDEIIGERPRFDFDADMNDDDNDIGQDLDDFFHSANLESERDDDISGILQQVDPNTMHQAIRDVRDTMMQRKR